jgi:hypothetical protein
MMLRPDGQRLFVRNSIIASPRPYPPPLNAEPFHHAKHLPFSRRLAQPDMAGLCDYWIALGGGTRVPDFRAFDPLAVPRTLPDLQILRREAGGRYRMGLTGANVAELMGGDNTGKYLDEVVPAARYAARVAMFDTALRTGLPVAFRALLATHGREHRLYKRFLLPFVDKDPAADLVLSMALSAQRAAAETISPNGDGILEVLIATPADFSPDAGLARETPIQ